jgi:hypothetical protein
MMGSWKALGVVAEGELITLSGYNLWAFEWVRSPEPAVKLPHPLYREQNHRFNIYEVSAGLEHHRFAAGEVSAGAWAFYQYVS